MEKGVIILILAGIVAMSLGYSVVTGLHSAGSGEQCKGTNVELTLCPKGDLTCADQQDYCLKLIEQNCPADACIITLVNIRCVEQFSCLDKDGARREGKKTPSKNPREPDIVIENAGIFGYCNAHCRPKPTTGEVNQ